MASCSLTLLGGFGLRSADGRELALSTRKDRLLLAYLALNAGQPLARDRLAGLLWGDRGETQARDSLRQSLAALRQAFRQVELDPVTSDRDSVGFDPNGIEIDVITFERLAGDSRTHTRAAALYRGALLDGIDGVTQEFEAWRRPERERLASIAVHLVEQIAQSPAPSEAAVCLARQLLARDSLCEPVYRALMRLHVAGGERAAAFQLYASCRDALKQELNVAPDLQTETLYRDILTDRPAQSTTSEHAKPEADRPSIAVLPFSNLSRDPELDEVAPDERFLRWLASSTGGRYIGPGEKPSVMIDPDAARVVDERRETPLWRAPALGAWILLCAGAAWIVRRSAGLR